MKVLLVSTVSGFVPQFEMNNVNILKTLGYDIHYAANYHNPNYGSDNSRLDGTDIIRHQVDFVRSPFHIVKNIKAFTQLNKVMKTHKFDLIHCHTPMGGVLGRIAGRKNKVPHIMYTAHGFHFYKGGSIIHNTLYYMIEKILARITDTLITINKEDYRNACKFTLKKDGQAYLVPGVGISSDYGDYHASEDIKLKYGIKKNAFVFTSVGELTKRKNHKYVIQALAQIREKDFVYIICGKGKLEQELKELIKENQLEDKVILTGYCTDIRSILHITDVYVFPSKQEGLPVGILEAMSMKLPVICTNIRGNIDLIDENGGIIVELHKRDVLADALLRLYKSERECKMYGDYNRERVKMFQSNVIEAMMKEIYTFELSKINVPDNRGEV